MTSKRYPLSNTHAKIVRLSRWLHLLVALLWLATLAVALSTGEGSAARPALLATTFLLCAAAAQYVTRRDAQARAETPAQP